MNRLKVFEMDGASVLEGPPNLRSMSESTEITSKVLPRLPIITISAQAAKVLEEYLEDVRRKGI